MGLPHYEPPADDEITAPFWRAIDDGEIRLPRCTVCGRWQWYPDTAGTECAGGELWWDQVATTGTVHTYTRVERAFLPGGRDDVPFVVGFVELDDTEGVRLVANIAEGPGGVRVGMRVSADFVPLGARRHLLFRPQP